MTTFREKEEILKFYQMSVNNLNQIGY